MDTKKMKELFKLTASAYESGESFEAFQAFAAALTVPILQKVEELSIMRNLFQTEDLEPGAQASYPIADDIDIPVWILPGLGYIAQNFIEGFGEEVVVPTFSIDASGDWKVQYARDARIDIPAKAAAAAAKAIANFEEECGWRVVIPAATSAFAGKGLLGPRNAPIYEISSGSTGAGYLSKYLINKMMTGFKRLGRTLTDLYVSPEDAADIRLWTDTEIDPVTRREIFVGSGLGSIWRVTLHEVNQLGAMGAYNLNSHDSGYGKFLLDASNKYNDYTATHPNKTDANGNVTTLGETQIYGFDLTENSLVMPIRKEYEAIPDPQLLRRQKQGFFGWEEVGFACLDSRMLAMGVIDRFGT